MTTFVKANVPAIRYRQHGHDIYGCVFGQSQLDAHINVERLDWLSFGSGFQRALDAARLKSITKYVEAGNMMPAALMVYTPEQLSFTSADGVTGELTIDSPLYIYDGQHRRAGILPAHLANFGTLVSVAPEVSHVEALKLFVTLNTKAKPLSVGQSKILMAQAASLSGSGTMDGALGVYNVITSLRQVWEGGEHIGISVSAATSVPYGSLAVHVQKMLDGFQYRKSGIPGSEGVEYESTGIGRGGSPELVAASLADYLDAVSRALYGRSAQKGDRILTAQVVGAFVRVFDVAPTESVSDWLDGWAHTHPDSITPLQCLDRHYVGQGTGVTRALTMSLAKAAQLVTA